MAAKHLPLFFDKLLPIFHQRFFNQLRLSMAREVSSAGVRIFRADFGPRLALVSEIRERLQTLFPVVYAEASIDN